MGHNFAYYIFVLIAVVVGFFVVKKVASCLIKTLDADSGGLALCILQLLPIKPVAFCLSSR